MTDPADPAAEAEPDATAIPHVTHKSTGFTRVINACGYSLNGLKLAYRSEAAFRQECWLALPALLLAMFLPVTGTERIALVGVTFLVLIVELLNSAIEAVVDRIGMEHHQLSGQAKDIGSAAVMLTLILWGYVWLTVLFLS